MLALLLEEMSLDAAEEELVRDVGVAIRWDRCGIMSPALLPVLSTPCLYPQ